VNADGVGAARAVVGRGTYVDRAAEPGPQASPASSASATRETRSRGFRPIQYLGSKMRLLPAIEETLGEVCAGRPGAVCDLFSGSAVISQALGARGDVIAVDIQEYARVLASGVLTGAAARSDVVTRVLNGAADGRRHQALTAAIQPLIDMEDACLAEARADLPQRLGEFIEGASVVRFAEDPAAAPTWLAPQLREAVGRLASLPPDIAAGTLITRLFGGSYFTFRQAVALDALRSEVCEIAPGPDRDLCLGALLSAASATVNTVGKQFAQPIRLRKKDGSFRRVLVEHTLHDRAMNVFDVYADWGVRWVAAAAETGGFKHEVVRADYATFLADWHGTVRAFYADPPYTIDHYSRFYHVLETLCLYDDPSLARMNSRGTLRLMRGLYRADRHQSPFCIPSSVGLAFRALFDGVHRFEAPLVLSYSPDRSDGGQRPRMMNLPTLLELARRTYRSVEVVSIQDHTHRKLNAEARNLAPLFDAEILLVCEH
jgi:adenine-specific DNA-methyltransferase